MTSASSKPSILSLYDVQGLAFGITMTSFGVALLQAEGLVTGQMAGLSVLLSYVIPVEFGVIFLLTALPFFYLAWKRRGPRFTIRTLAAVLGISSLTPILSAHVAFDATPSVLAAVLAGACSGVGLIALFRHDASAGGLGILALVIEERTGFRTGWFQLCFDALVFGAAFVVLAPEQVVVSFVGAVVMNALIAWNFRASSQAKSQ